MVPGWKLLHLFITSYQGQSFSEPESNFETNEIHQHLVSLQILKILCFKNERKVVE